ncbi:MAG: hypothetical protein A2Y78_00155 [Acidobacteria bacterium RBG_13_68_16]|nr:MAG: hypothetical protein A2Y78_00155 [Acidobacteria bacterium RBG_13_68_16]
MGVFDALLGRILSNGTELELQGGIDFGPEFSVTPNRAAKTLGVKLDILNSFTWIGNATTVAAGAAEVVLALDGADTTLDVADVLANGTIVDLGFRVVVQSRPSTSLDVQIDSFVFGFCYDTTESEYVLIDDATGDTVATHGTLIEGYDFTVASGNQYQINFGEGEISLSLVQTATARSATVTTWRSRSTEVAV